MNFTEFLLSAAKAFADSLPAAPDASGLIRGFAIPPRTHRGAPCRLSSHSQDPLRTL